MLFSRKMLHLIMTLLVHGAYMESAKCPESCTCVQTLISSSSKEVTFKNLDEGNIARSNPEQIVNAYQSDLYRFGITDTTYKLKIISVNDTFSLPQTKKCGKNNKDSVRDIFLHNFFIKSIKISETSNFDIVRAKRTLHKVDKANANRTEENPSWSENKLEVTEEPSRNKDVFTYQISCTELRDLKSVWIRDLPTPVTELNIQKTKFQSFKAFQQILKESSIELNQLTVLSVSDNVINQNPRKRFSVKTRSANKEESLKNEKHSEFLPFASLQNPKLRSTTESEFIANGKCKNLQILNLTNSTIIHLPQETFLPFINLQVLNLSNNLIEYIDNETFSSLANLLYLDIHNNQLQSLNEIMFKNLTKLLFLDVSQNLISKIEPSTFQYLVSLNVLILASNPLSEKHEAVVLLGAGKRLQIVDISKTGLKQIPGTLERSVRVLNLMGNLLLSIRCGDLDSYSLLAYLDLKGNKISYVEDDALGRLEFLKNLQLGENNLFQVPKILSNNLEILNLSYNNIQNITNLDFLNLSLLKELFLNYNQITSIELNAFNNLVHLKVLDLSRNPILMLPNIYGEIKLAILDLSYFTNIPGSYGTKYKQFPVQSPQTVKHLNLESSPVLTKIFLQDTKTLESFTSLEKLNVRFTNLTTIRKDIFSILPKLKVLKVEGNPWHCGKEILTLSNWLRSHEDNENIGDEDEVNTAHCLTPPQLYKINLITLEEKDLEKGRRESENRLAATAKKNSSGDLPIVKVEKGSKNKFTNASGTNSGELPLVKIEDAIKYNKTSANVSFFPANNRTETSNSENCCGNSVGKTNSSRNNSTAAYLLPSKRGVIESSNQTATFLNLRNVLGWNGDSTKSKRKDLINLKSKKVSLTTVKKAEAVTAKDTLSLQREYNSHLSFLVISSIGLVVVATLTFTSLYFTRTRRDQSYQRQNQDIEVCSISSLGNELWWPLLAQSETAEN